MLTIFKPKKHVHVEHMSEPKGRLIAIGDVHGCVDELVSLVTTLKVAADDLVVLLGDLVDRGPDPESVVQYVKENGFTTVLGNHDSKVTRYHYHVLLSRQNPSYKIPMKAPQSYFGLSESSLKLLANAPHAIFIPKLEKYEFPIALVHAGLSPAGFHQDPQAFIRNRYFIKNHATNTLTPVKSVQIDGIWHVPENSYPWTYFWDGRWTVVYGHNVHWDPEVVNNTIGIDAGCCFGGALRAWVLENGSSFFVDIPAKNRYSEDKG